MTVTVQNVPRSALPVIADQLRKFGVTVVFETEISGRVESVCGELRFHHDGNALTLTLVQDSGHFPVKMLVGGIRQMVEEAVEKVNRQAVGA